MKILNVYGQEPVVTIVNDRDIKFAQRCYIDVITDEGCLSYDISPGFITNGRSGTGLIDGLIPHFGNKSILTAWILHDINYYEFISKDLADEVLRQMLIKAGMNRFKASLVKKSVQWFGSNAYGLNTKEELDMSKLIHFKWIAVLNDK